MIADSNIDPKALCVPLSDEAWNETLWCKKVCLNTRWADLEAYEQLLMVLVNLGVSP